MEINPALRAAYAATRFIAHVPGRELEILIGQNEPALDDLLTQLGETEWVYISAWNPRSALMSSEANSVAQTRLEAELRASGYRFFPGEGIPAGSEWDPEASVLVLGVARDEAADLGRRYGQNAIVVGSMGQPASLVFLD